LSRITVDVNDDLGNPIILTLPQNDNFGDALRRLAEAVNLVAFLENRSPESVLVDIRDRSTQQSKHTI
jgi:hypothetical protein